ncbi:DUF1850 domain-containing protein [Castellaniella caeni]
MLGVCFTLAAALQVPPRFVPVQAFTLAWTHSIEKIRWEEDYRVARDAQGHPVLIPGKARILGSGAGICPAPRCRAPRRRLVRIPAAHRATARAAAHPLALHRRL